MSDSAFSLLFTGLLINRDAIAPWFKWLYNFSFFHAAYEALTVNELRYLTLKERRVSKISVIEIIAYVFFQYGIDIEIPTATVLSLFGLRAQASISSILPPSCLLCL